MSDSWDSEPLNLAANYLQAGRLDEAEGILRSLLARDPQNPIALEFLAIAASATNRQDLATSLVGQAIVIDPTNARLYATLGEIERRVGNYQAAMAAIQRALELNPNLATAHFAKVDTLVRLGRFPEAQISISKVIELDPNNATAHHQLAAILQMQGKFPEAMLAFDKAMSLSPSDPAIHTNRARLSLLMGNLHAGWEEFEWRFKVPVLGLNRGFHQPQWDGRDPSGMTLLLESEGGHGDTLHFIRLAERLMNRGAKLILECQPALVRLLSSIQGFDRIVVKGDPLPPFDMHVPPIGLCRIFNVTLENIPNRAPYLFPPPGEAERWNKRLPPTEKLRVGLVWAGSQVAADDLRTRSLQSFAPLAQVEGVQFLSLQKGPGSAETPPPSMDWIDLTADIQDFADVAALIQNLDLVITVDTAAAHLAGALGKPVWVLLGYVCDFRWLTERSDSPWHPTMRLFRQSSPTDWDTPISQIVQALRALALRI